MFDTVLIESAHPVGDGRKARSLPFAIALHAAVLAALVLSAIWSTGEAPEPPLPVVFPVRFVGTPPSQGEGGPTTSGPRHREVVPVRAETPPTRIPDAIPAVVEDEPIANDAYGGGQAEEVDLDGGGGSGDGSVPGGTGEVPGGQGIGESPILDSDAKGVRPPVLVLRVEPDYPETARRLRMEGVAILRAVITTSGVVDELQIRKSAGPLLDAAAIAAVQRWVYRPATRDGRSVAVYLDVTVTFGLRS